MIEPFIATYSGGKVYPLGPRPEDIKIEDVAHSLSQLCRYNGHTSEFWSVAAHSLEVSRRLEAACPHQPVLWLIGLMHDASESLLTDIPAPIKPMIVNYKLWENNAELAVAKAFKLPFPFPAEVNAVDKDLVRSEVANFFPPGSPAWERHNVKDRRAFPVLYPLTPREGEEAFLRRYQGLQETVRYWYGGHVAA